MRKMKDSGIKWIGKIPETWEVTINKTILKNISERNHPDAEVLSLYRDLGVVPKNSRDDNHNVTSENTIQYKFVEKGSLVINKMKAWQGSLAVSNYEGIVSPAYYVCKFRDNQISKDYVHYLLRSSIYAQQFERLSTGMRIGQWDLSIDDFLATPLLVPPEKEQAAIAKCLDKKSMQIDALIANVQEQIEKLKAYKQSLITEVVTKGLDPNVPMKDSGVEWIGEIANTRSVYRLKYLLSTPLQYGANESGGKYKNDSVRYIRITDICADGSLKNDENNQYLSEKVASDYVLNDGDVLLARSGGTVGKSFLYHAEYGASAFAGYLIKADCNRDKLLPEFLVYYTQSSLYDIWKNMIFVQATIQNIGANKYSNLEIPIPPVDEQRTLVKELKVRCSKIDSLIHIKQQKIEKLEQYKRSLIYEYVTGKKEVS